MTPAELDLLPASSLPQALITAGLAPDPAMRALLLLPWAPQARWSDAMMALAALGDQGWMWSISWVPPRPEGKQGYLELWNTGRHYARYFVPENGPEMLCRLVLEATLSQEEAPR